MGKGPGVGPPDVDESELPDGTETVTIEVYDTMTLTLTLPSDVRRSRSVLLGVVLVDVVSEELCIQLFEVKAVPSSPDWSALEDVCEEFVVSVDRSGAVITVASPADV